MCAMLTWDDPAYPQRLLNIYDPPFVLYVRGELKPEDDWAVAIVGTAGLRSTGWRLRGGWPATWRPRARADHQRPGAASMHRPHRAALDAGGRTLAVLGSSVDVIYPSDNRKLAHDVIANGALLSEYALGTQPEASNFLLATASSVG